MRYKIKNWSDYQHYKDRCPPWIKLHNSLLTSEVWVMGNDATRALVIASMLLASRNNDNDGTFNGDPEYVKRFAYLNSLPDFKPLIKNGFIEMVQDASTVLARCNTETEERREENTSVSHEKVVFDGSSFTNLNGYLATWKSAYPAIDVEAEISKAASWLASNPKNKKSNYPRFLNNWLCRAQDKAPRLPVDKSETPEEFARRMTS